MTTEQSSNSNSNLTSSENATDSSIAEGNVKPMFSSYVTITTITGIQWNPEYATTDETWRHYLQVPYTGFTTGESALTVSGSGLNYVVSVTCDNSSYTPQIVSQNSSTLQLYLLATPNSNTTAQPDTWITLYFGDGHGGYVSTGCSIIPSFNTSAQGPAFGQCTWYAGYIARNACEKSVVGSYGGTALSGNQTSAGYPLAKSVICLFLGTAEKHFVFLDSVDSSTSGGITTLTLHCKDTNWDYHDGTISSFDATMKYNSSSYAITQYPVIRSATYTVYINH